MYENSELTLERNHPSNCGHLASFPTNQTVNPTNPRSPLTTVQVAEAAAAVAAAATEKPTKSMAVGEPFQMRAGWI